MILDHTVRLESDNPYEHLQEITIYLQNSNSFDQEQLNSKLARFLTISEEAFDTFVPQDLSLREKFIRIIYDLKTSSAVQTALGVMQTQFFAVLCKIESIIKSDASKAKRVQKVDKSEQIDL